MCRYRYGDSKCAHPKNVATECVGEDNCTCKDDDLEDLQPPSDMQNSSGFQEKTDEISESEEDTCPMTECGVYCEKFNRFYCAGEDNCQTEDEYLEHMNEYGGVDIERDREDGPDEMR